MTDYRSETGVGARIKLARRQRGYRTTRELADAIPGGNVTAAVLENIESGRKADISVSQLLNIARGLGVPPSMLLAPIGSPNSGLDLPNLSDHFDGMTAAEFDCWLSATPASSYKPRLAAERFDTEVLNSLRELGTLRRELERLRIVLDVQSASGDPDLLSSNEDVRNRIDRVTSEAARVAGLLVSAGISDGSGNAS
jgi:transcriptional regulator with XRE-family HTH domain